MRFVLADGRVKGVAITLAGVLVLSPDALLLRLLSCDPGTVLFWRGLGFAGVLSAWLAARGRLGDVANAARQPILLSFAATLALATTCFVTAVRYTTVANALVLYGTAPLFAALLGLVVARERLPAHTWLAVALGMMAVATTVEGSTVPTLPGTAAARLGDAAALGAGACWGLVATLRRLRPGADFLPALALSGWLTAGLALPGARPLMLAGTDLVLLGALCLLVIPISFALITLGPRYLPAPDVALLLLLETVLAPLWVWLVLGEAPEPQAVLGGLLLLATLAMNTIWNARTVRAPNDGGASHDRALVA